MNAQKGKLLNLDDKKKHKFNPNLKQIKLLLLFRIVGNINKNQCNLILKNKKSHMRIRKAKISDKTGIGKVHVDSWLSTYKGIMPDEKLNQLSYERSEKKWKLNIESSLDNPKEILLVAEKDNKIVGFCSGGLNQDKKTLKYESDLAAIYILKEFQKKGIGRNLVLEFINCIQKINLNSMIIWVLKDNQSKIFYEKIGGSLVAEKEYEFYGKILKGIAYGWDKLDKAKNILIRNNSKYYWENEFRNTSFDYKKLASKKSWNNFIQEIKDKNIKTVLDFGSGGGHWSVILARNGFKVKAIDISSNAIKKLLLWSKDETLDIETEVCGIQDYKDENKYDLIICNSVLDHLLLDDIRKVIKIIHSLLDDNGYAYISFDGLEEDNNDNYDILENGIKLYKDEGNYGMIWKYYNKDEISSLCKDFKILNSLKDDDKRKYIWLKKK